MFSELPSFESITRARRKIQNTDGKYLPTEATVLRRRHKEEEMRIHYRYKY